MSEEKKDDLWYKLHGDDGVTPKEVIDEIIANDLGPYAGMFVDESYDGSLEDLYDKNYTPSGSGGGWHIDKICDRLMINDPKERAIIKYEFDECLKKGFMFSGLNSKNSPEASEKETLSHYIEHPRSLHRTNDPKVLDSFYRVGRAVYFAMENVPLINSLELWSHLDRIVLKDSQDPTVAMYLEKMQESFGRS